MQPSRRTIIGTSLALVIAAVAILFWWRGSLPAELAGVWKVEWQQYNGVAKRVPRELWVMRPGELIIVTDENTQQVRLLPDATKSPKRFETSLTLFPRGIYEVNGDELRVCQVPSTAPIPANFDPQPFEFQCITVLRRVAGANNTANERELQHLLIQQFGTPKRYPSPRKFDADAEKFVASIMQRLDGPGPQRDDPKRMVWNISWLISEIENGGFQQFMYNSSGDNSAETARHLRLLGAEQTAAMVDRARAQFPNGVPSANTSRRRQELDGLTPAQLEALDDLDQQFYSREEDLCLMLKNYWQASPSAPAFPDLTVLHGDPITATPSEPAPWRRIVGTGMIVLLAGVVIFGIFRAINPPWLATIVVADGKVMSHKGVAKAHVPNVVRFFEHDVALVDHTTIRVARHSDGALNLKVTGPIDPGTRQQIRNFLITVL